MDAHEVQARRDNILAVALLAARRANAVLSVGAAPAVVAVVARAASKMRTSMIWCVNKLQTNTVQYHTVSYHTGYIMYHTYDIVYGNNTTRTHVCLERTSETTMSLVVLFISSRSGLQPLL